MFCHLRIEAQFVISGEEATKTAKDVNVIVVVLKHRHDGIPELFERFVVVITGEDVQQVLVMLWSDCDLDLEKV